MTDVLDPRSLPRLIVPPLDPEPWPTLGPEVCDFIVDYLVHGPGDVLGRKKTLLPEVRAFIYRAYEVYPRNHELAGRRRFKRVVFSRRKGFAKTEDAACIGIVEMDPKGPVRCDGWKVLAGEWVPVGRPIVDPYIPMVATTEEQSDDLAYGAAVAILKNCDLGNFYDIGKERIMHRDAPGVMKALASAPSARDGARTTFQHFDETHLFTSPRLRDTHWTMRQNVLKRIEADAWSLETSTMYAPGEESVAEDSHSYALKVLSGEVDESTLLFDHRQASELHDLETKSGLIAAIEEASGDAILFCDVPAIAGEYRDPNGDKNRWRRFWLNQRRRDATRWLAEGVWDARSHEVVHGEPRGWPADGSPIVLAFDGSYSRDSTALVACTVTDEPIGEPYDPDAEEEEREPVVVPEGVDLPYIFVVRAWERRDSDGPNWRTPRSEVLDEVDMIMERFNVVELAPDPPGWVHEVEGWESTYGEVVVRFETNQPTRTGPAVDQMGKAAADGLFTHDGDPRMAIHVGNCVTVRRGKHTIVDKPGGQDSSDKIDLAMGALIAYTRAQWHAFNLVGDTPFAFA